MSGDAHLVTNVSPRLAGTVIKTDAQAQMHALAPCTAYYGDVTYPPVTRERWSPRPRATPMTPGPARSPRTPRPARNGPSNPAHRSPVKFITSCSGTGQNRVSGAIQLSIAKTPQIASSLWRMTLTRIRSDRDGGARAGQPALQLVGEHQVRQLGLAVLVRSHRHFVDEFRRGTEGGVLRSRTHGYGGEKAAGCWISRRHPHQDEERSGHIRRCPARGRGLLLRLGQRH
jgi:hypothetical protein